MSPKSWILVLVALPALAAPQQPFVRGDVVSTAVGVPCGPHPDAVGAFASLYRPSTGQSASIKPSWYQPGDGTMTYSSALDAIVLVARDAEGRPTLATIGADGDVKLMAKLPAPMTAIAGAGPEIVAAAGAPHTGYALWRLAAADGGVIEKIDLPVLTSGQAITSIDLSADRCTLAYASMNGFGEPVHRYDICRRQPLADLGVRASAVRYLPSGELLVAEDVYLRGGPWYRWLTRYDRLGRLLSTSDLNLVANIRAIALDPEGETAWLVSRPYCVGGFPGTMAVSTATLTPIAQILTGPFYGTGDTSIAVAGEWRAAEHPLPRRRAVH